MQIIFLTTSLLVSFFIIDLLALVILKKSGRSIEPLLFNLRLIKQSRTFRNVAFKKIYQHYMAYDAALGYRFKANCKNFVFDEQIRRCDPEVVARLKNYFEIHTDKYGYVMNKADQEQRDYQTIANNPRIYKIIASGGSITSGSGTSKSENSWPAILENTLNNEKKFTDKYDKVLVINDSCLGSNISHHIARFQNEVIYLKPDLVISMCGIIANYSYFGNPIDELYSQQQKEMADRFNINWFFRQNIFLPNLKNYLTETSKYKQYIEKIYPYKNEPYIKLSAADLFISKVKQFKAICNSHDVDFIQIFHPIMGIGKKELTNEEENLKRYFKRYFFSVDWNEYLKVITEYSNQVRKNLTEDYQFDLVDIFENAPYTIYTDPRHPNDEGHKIIAQAIRKIVIERL